MSIHNLSDYGASSELSTLANRDILQSAMKQIDEKGRGVLIVPPDINYGYKRNTLSTHPDFSNIVNDILIIDYSMNTQYSQTEGDGMQVRFISKTFNETDGGHDGNTMWLQGHWHPAYMIMNMGGPDAGNRRATLFFGNDGEVTWGVGQGINTKGQNAPSDASQDYLSHFKLIGNKIAGGSGLETLLAINKENGFWGFGGMADPEVEYHVRTKRGTKGQIKFESHNNNLEFELATPGKTRKFTLRSDNGSLNITDLTGKSNVVTITGDGQVIAKDGININVNTLPSDATAGRLVYHDGKVKLFNGTTWNILG
jgi:hypothetical protein